MPETFRNSLGALNSTKEFGAGENMRSALSTAQSQAQLDSLCAIVCQQLGFEWYHFNHKFSFAQPQAQPFTLTNFPTTWQQRYISESLAETDPHALHAQQHTTALAWADIEPQDWPNPDQVNHFLQAARATGLRTGITIPVHGSQGEHSRLDLASPNEDPASQARAKQSIPQATIIATYLHEAAMRIRQGQGQTGIELPTMTKREKECLTWIADGKTTGETAVILAIAERTVSFHLQNAVEKLGVSNRSQAVARAISLRLITATL